MTKPIAVIVCVEYWDILQMTLPYNYHNFDKIIIVTSTQEEIPLWFHNKYDNDEKITIFRSPDFYTNGAHFNKWLPLEQGLELAGVGWICILDADILIPQQNMLDGWKDKLLDTSRLSYGKLYTPLRRMYPELRILPEYSWSDFPIHPNVNEWSGYFQLFHTSDLVLGPRPWHEINWKHAGGADTFFQAKWAPENKIRPTWQVLHLGLEGRNWCGRSTPYVNGAVPTMATHRRNQLQQIAHQRRETGNYDHEKF